MAELRQELDALGYGALPDDFIVSSLSQLPPPQSWNRDGSSGGVRFEEKSSRQVHGPPVPGDREFATSRKSSARKGGMDSVCFTPGFATELDGMRKMLKVMQGTKEEVFGSGSRGSTLGTSSKPIGVADESETYVGKLLGRWRLVGRSIRSKRKEGLAEDVGHRQNQHEAVLDRDVQPPAEPSTSGELGRPGDGCDPQSESVTVAERNEGNRSAEDELSSPSSSFVGTAKESVIANDSNEEALNDGCTNGLKSEIRGLVDAKGIDTGPVFTRQQSSSAISPGVSYQQGGMLYPEDFTTDTHQQSELIMSEEIPLPSHEEAEENSFSPSPRSSSDQLIKEQMLDNLSATSTDEFSQDDQYPKDIIDQEMFAHSISDSKNHGHESVPIAQQPAESENPFDLGVPVMVRTPTPDQRGGGGDRHQSPLNDRSNMRIAEDQMVKKTELHPAKALKRSSSVMLNRSRSSREVSRRKEIVEKANDKHLVDTVTDGSQVDSHLLFENKPTTPTSSARKLKSERFLGNSKSLAFSRRRNVIVEEANERSCVANGFSEHRQGSHCSACSTVRNSSENNSPSTTTGSKSPFGRNLSKTALRETEASTQQKRSVRKERGAGSGSLLKQKVASNKSASAVPSGIYTPLVDPKENDLNSDSKMILKTGRLGSSMDFASDSSRLTERRPPSLRLRTESSRSSGPQPGPYAQSQVSKSNSVSPYAKSSFSSRSATLNATPKDTLSSHLGKTPSFTSYGSRSSATTKDTLTPGGPRRGGKVDR